MFVIEFLTAFDHMLEPGGVMRFYAHSFPNHANPGFFPDPNEITKLVSKACVNDTKLVSIHHNILDLLVCDATIA